MDLEELRDEIKALRRREKELLSKTDDLTSLCHNLAEQLAANKGSGNKEQTAVSSKNSSTNSTTQRGTGGMRGVMITSGNGNGFLNGAGRGGGATKPTRTIVSEENKATNNNDTPSSSSSAEKVLEGDMKDDPKGNSRLSPYAKEFVPVVSIPTSPMTIESRPHRQEGHTKQPPKSVPLLLESEIHTQLSQALKSKKDFVYPPTTSESEPSWISVTNSTVSGANDCTAQIFTYLDSLPHLLMTVQFPHTRSPPTTPSLSDSPSPHTNSNPTHIHVGVTFANTPTLNTPRNISIVNSVLQSQGLAFFVAAGRSPPFPTPFPSFPVLHSCTSRLALPLHNNSELRIVRLPKEDDKGLVVYRYRPSTPGSSPLGPDFKTYFYVDGSVVPPSGILASSAFR